MTFFENNVSNLSTRQRAILKARQILTQTPVYIDTETTGLDRNDEIVEISVVAEDGSTIFETLVRPSRSIPAGATAVHGLTDAMVLGKPTWPVIFPTLRTYIAGKVLVFYNAGFDLRMMQQSHARYRLPWKEHFTSADVMLLYADFRAEWDPIRRSNRWFSLDTAGKQSRIPLPNAHRASADALLTRALLHHIAESPEIPK
jgi:DNA polymerase-3 subunit epsilon